MSKHLGLCDRIGGQCNWIQPRPRYFECLSCSVGFWAGEKKEEVSMREEICRNFGHVWDLSEDEVNECISCGELDFDSCETKEEKEENMTYWEYDAADSIIYDMNYCIDWIEHQWKADFGGNVEVCSRCHVRRKKIYIEDKMYQVSNDVSQGTLPQDAKERKNIPMCTGVLDYFPDALAEIAIVSKAGNDQHNPGQSLHWAKEKSTDHADCIVRHLTERGTRDTDGMRHSAKTAWRALALLQTEIENEKEGN